MVGNEIDQFWRQMFPCFTGYEFVYLFLDLISVLTFMKAMLFLPTIMLMQNKKVFNDRYN